MTSLCGNFTSAPRPRCFVELSATVSSGTLAYITLLLTVYLRWSKPRDDARRLFAGHTLRCVLSLLFLFVHLAEFGEILAGGKSWILASVSCSSWICVQFFYYTIEKFGRAHYLGVTSLLYLASGLARGVLLYTLLEEIDMTYVSTNLAAVSSALSYAVSLNDLVTLINEIKLEKHERKLPIGEYESYVHEQSHWFSRVTFFWLTPLLRIGYTNPIEPEDLGKLPVKESTSTQYQRFLETYQKIKNDDGPSLWKCYFRCYWKNFFIGGILKLIGDFVGLIAPLGIAIVIDYVASQKSHEMENFVTLEGFIKNGYVMAIIIFVSALAQASFSQASTHVINVEGIRLKTALQGMIYAKTLKLSISNKDDDSSSSESKHGTTTNLMSEDTFNVMTCMWIGHYTWAIPLKITVLMYLLYRCLGLSAIIGALFCIVTMTPLQFLIGKKMSDNSKVIANSCDERLRMTNEMLQGIKVLKLCGWEIQFYLRVMAARNKEIKFLNKDSLYWALMTFLTHASSSLITLVTLGAYYYLEGTNLSVSNVFSALALFNQLTVPLFIFPITVPIIISALVSTRRLEDFFSLPESTSYSPLDVNPRQKYNYVKQDSDKEKLFGLRGISEELDDYTFEDDLLEEEKIKGANACILREAGFSWGDQEKPGLWINNLNIPKGQLTAVIGRVGCGKSSFLNALLGEMRCVAGLMKWEKEASFAYVSQQPWILNATLRENVLMGLSYKARRFARVISATALQPDIDILPNKDLTELGEKGINLSGGQRQRIAIARALYSKANVIILDDPLSALDYHVAQHVFENGIMNLVLKQNKTVIMVTHSLHLLTYAHKVVALESGRMRACGKLTDMELVDGVVTGVDTSGDSRGRTARERWQLVKLVSRIGHHIRQQNMKYQNKQLFIPFRKRLSTGSEYYWAQDLPLPNSMDGDREMPLQRSTTLPRHRPVARATSLQPHSSNHMNPVTRQASSPSINQGTRGRTYTFDGIPPGGGNLLKHIFMSSNKNVQNGMESQSPPGSFKEKNLLKRLMSSTSIKSVVYNENEKHPIQRLPSTCSDYSDDCYEEDEDLDPDWCGTNTTDERQYGTISPFVYFSYLRACGLIASILYLFLAISWQALRVYTDFWLSEWTQGSPSHSNNETLYYLIIYTGFTFSCVFISLVSNLLGQYCGAQARKRLHKNMLLSVVRLPLKIFEATPLGRILARFSTDVNKLATSIQRLVQFLLLCFSAILVNSIVTPWFLILAVPICIFYYIVQKFYRSSSRELQRLDSMSRTPILSHLTESLSGLETIRAFKQQKRFTVAMFYKLDSHTNAFLIANSATRWLGIALDYLGAVIVLLAMIVSIICGSLLPDVVTPALVGLAINYTLLVPIYLNWVVKFLSDVEMYMAGVERICHYIKMPPEDYKQISKRRSFLSRVISPEGLIWKNWPSKGEILFESVSLRYDHSQEVAVTNLNLLIPPGQKVGICGRTGSGKSSLVMSLFGMTPVIEGIIYIDGVDISTAPLQYLRSRLSVIPQDVIMFSGSIRENLDLDNQFTDMQLWEALEMAQLKDIVSSQLGGLNGQVREGGVNLSSGQRQLLCLARAILRQTACLIMDEATSSLDVATEKTLIHAAEKAFANKTIITIAHRLTTLLSCDRILVLESGRVVEDGSPAELLSRSMGIFSTMLRAAEDHSHT